MRIYTRSGDLAFSTFNFPDGQPHFRLETVDDSGFISATIETAIKTTSDLVMVGLAVDVLRSSGFSELQLDIRYLLGARMDRAISSAEPFTLAVVARFINSCGFSRVRILDVHSDVAIRLIRNSVNMLPHRVVEQVRTTIGSYVVVCPDKGAVERTRLLSEGRTTIYCSKVRDMSTGALTGFKVDVPFPTDKYSDFEALIVDDICDGGGTFVGLAKELRRVGAKKVFLYCTHGIFSRGLPLDGIDHVYTTDSYFRAAGGPNTDNNGQLTTIPISMKEIS